MIVALNFPIITAITSVNQVLCLPLLASVLACRGGTPVSNLVMALVNGVFFSLP